MIQSSAQQINSNLEISDREPVADYGRLVRELQEQEKNQRGENGSIDKYKAGGSISSKSSNDKFLMVPDKELGLDLSNENKSIIEAVIAQKLQYNQIEKTLKQESQPQICQLLVIKPQKETNNKTGGLLEPQKKFQRILESKVIKSKEKFDLRDIEEQSEIIPRDESGDEGSHFQVEQIPGQFQFFLQLREENTNKPKINNPSNLLQLPNTSKVSLSQRRSIVQHLKQTTSDRKNTDSFSFRQLSKKQSIGKDNLPSKDKDPFNLLEDKLSQSRVIEGEGKDEGRNNRNLQSKKPLALVQVSPRMKSTYDPKKPQHQSNSGGNGFLSERDNYSAQNQPQDHPKFIIDQILDPSVISQQKRKVSLNQIMDQILTLQKEVGIIKDIPNDQSVQNMHLPPLKCSNGSKSKQIMRMSRKIETLKNLAPEELLNGYSSIESDRQAHRIRKIGSKDNNEFNNYQTTKEMRVNKKDSITNQLEFLTEKIMKLQKVISKKQTSNFLDSMDEIEHHRNGHNHNSRTKLLRHRSEKMISYSVEQGFINIEQLEIPQLQDGPTPYSSHNELVSIGERLIRLYKIKNRSNVAIYPFQNRVQYHLLDKQENGVFIIWEFSGLFYLGAGIIVSKKLIKQGKAMQILPGKYIYRGSFHQNSKDGEGAISFSNGVKYKGSWSNNQYEGYGQLTNKQSKYKGYFHQGQKHGKGKQKYANGDYYEGDYLNDKYEGVGKYIWGNGMIYSGDFKNGEMDGYGCWKSPKGDTYQGQYYKNLKHGYGRYRWKSGQVFEGQFRKGEKLKQSGGILVPENELSCDDSQSWDSMDKMGSKLSPTLTIKKKFTVERDPSRRI